MISNALTAASDVELRSALLDANIPTLLIVTAQLSGDDSLLEGSELPSRTDIDGMKFISAERAEEIRERAFEVLRGLRGQALPALPDVPQLNRLASVLVGEPVAPEYIPMMLEDMGFTDSALSRVGWKAKPERDTRFNVAIVGCGISGIAAAVHLKRAGIDFEIIEKNPAIGGTWWENTYPDCGVDTPNHFYSYSFAPNPNWPGFYSKRDDIQAYLERVVDQFELRPHIRFDTTASRIEWERKENQWRIETEGPRGRSSDTANAVFCAVGQLNQPRTPEIPGAESFAGPAFHSARWQHEIDLTGKRVAVIGTGASAMQFAPAIADKVQSLTIFQRSKHWLRVLPDYHRNVPKGKQWLLDHIPYYQNWYRFKLFWTYGDGLWESLHSDPDWPHPERSLNADNERHRQIFESQLRRALNNREDLIEKVLPEYPPFGKRMLIDNHWCDMLQRDDVTLLCSGVSGLTKSGVLDDAGNEHPADAVIYATGFHAHRFVWPMEVVGRSGATLDETWGEDGRAYMGMTAPDFPNLFFFYGPNSNLGHGGSIIFHSECQARYAVQSLIDLIEAGGHSLEVRRAVFDDYNARVDAEHNKMVWTHGNVDNWYRNAKGRVVSNSPWRLVDYWQMTFEPDLADYDVS